MKKPIRYHKAKTQGRQLAMPEGLPGLRGRANWHVTESGPGETPSTINYRGGAAKMSLPDENKFDKLTVIHEMLHAAHSPVEPPREIERPDGTKISIDAILISEEIRINMMMRYGMGSEWTHEHLNEPGMLEVLDFHLKHPSPKILEFLLIQHLCSWPLYKGHIDDVWSPVMGLLYNLTLYLPDGATEELREYYRHIKAWLSSVTLHIQAIGYDNESVQIYKAGGIPSWIECTIPVADYLDKVFTNVQQAHDLISNAAQQNNNPTHAPDLQKILDKNPRSRSMTRQINQLAEDPTGVPSPVNFMMSEGEPKWGAMDIVEPKRTERLPGKHLQKNKYRSTDMGVVPRNIHRTIIDGNVFAVKRQTLGGSVLIDDSGSMSWLPEQIEAVMIAAPAVIVAAYSGARTRGELKILAKDKKRVPTNDIKTRYGGNDIDMPALEWLAAQTKPRIWVTDGGVHPGISGNSIVAAEQCVEFCEKNDINVVENAKQAHEVFMGQRAIYR